METIDIDLEKLAEWGKPKRIVTQDGEKDVRTAPATDKFWNIYRAHKAQLREAGVSCTKRDEKWFACWWRKVEVSPEEVQRQKALAEASRALDTDAEILYPDGLEPRGYQRAGVAFAMECFKNKRGVLIGDEMGLGKTIQAILLINMDPKIRKVVIVCPNTLKGNWKRELQKWLTRPMKIGIQYADRPFCGDFCDIVIVNFDIAYKFDQLRGMPWDLRIIDECHYTKNPKARRTKATLDIPAKRKASLSGTAIENRTVELWPTISDLYPEMWDPKKGFFKFALRYCGATQNSFGWDMKGNTNSAELQHKLRSTIMVRRLKADVLKELPPKRRQIIELENPDNVGIAGPKEMDRLEGLMAAVRIAEAGDSLEKYAAAVEELEHFGGASFDEMSALRYETGMGKIKQAIEFIDDALENGKVLVFCHHLDVVNAFKKHWTQAAVITGEVKVQDRMPEVDRFQNDPNCNVFIGNGAAAEGITLTAADHVIFVEGDWVPGKLAQKEDRAHRIGQRNSVLVTHLVLERTIDAHMIRENVKKQDAIEKVLDRKTDYTPEEAKGGVSSVTVEKKEPVQRTQSVSVSPAKVTQMIFDKSSADALKVSDKLASLTHRALQMLSGMCDGASTRDDHGFNGTDTRFGKSLAAQDRLTRRQTLLASRMVVKYKRQIGQLADDIREERKALGI